MTTNIKRGQRIKTIRQQLGLSQEEFGHLITPPANRSAVSKWEHGNGPVGARMRQIAKIGGVSVNFLNNGSDDLLAEVAAKVENLRERANSGKLSSREKQELKGKLNEESILIASGTRVDENKWHDTVKHLYKNWNHLSLVEQHLFATFIQTRQKIQDNIKNSNYGSNTLVLFDTIILEFCGLFKDNEIQPSNAKLLFKIAELFDLDLGD